VTVVRCVVVGTGTLDWVVVVVRETSVVGAGSSTGTNTAHALRYILPSRSIVEIYTAVVNVVVVTVVRLARLVI
jgi:hypothetical protein